MKIVGANILFVSAAIVFLARQAFCEYNGKEERLMMKFRESICVVSILISE